MEIEALVYCHIRVSIKSPKLNENTTEHIPAWLLPTWVRTQSVSKDWNFLDVNRVHSRLPMELRVRLLET